MMSRSGKQAPATYKYAHKLFEPRARGGAVVREQLLSRIFGKEPPPVVLLQGPAGHGKTTLLQQALEICREQGQVVGWLSVDEADNDLRRLAMHLHAMVNGMEETVAGAPPRKAVRTPSRGLIEEGGSRADGLIARLVALDDPAVICLDDFHTLENRAVLNFFRDLLEHLPEGVRVLMGSRTVPDVGLARLVVNNQAVVLRAGELCFSPQEVQQFFQQASELGLREDECHSIHRKTEGWPAALQLFRLSLASPSVRESLTRVAAHQPSELADYLADNVLALQSKDMQQFLIRTGPLTRLSAALCNEVLERHDSQQILEELERGGLFLRSLDAQKSWFSYHALFANFLSAQLREEDPALLRQIHHRAAAWFLEAELHEPAMHHAVAAANYSLAAEVLDAWASRLIALGHLVTVESWYETLPLQEVAKRPELLVKVSWALCFLRRHQKLRPILPLLEQLPSGRVGETQPDVVRSMLAFLDDDIERSGEIVNRIDVEGQTVEGFPAFELAAAANLRGYLAMLRGELEHARELLNLARSHGETAQAGFSLGYSISTQAMNLMVQGELPEALARLKAASDAPWTRLDDSVSSAVVAASYVQALYEAGDIDAAAKRFESARQSIANFALLDYAATAFVVMSRIHELRSHPSQSVEVLEQAEAIGHSTLWPRLVRIVAWERVRRHLLRGELDRAEVAASRIQSGDQALPDGWLSFVDDTEGDLVHLARLQIHRGDADAALKSITPEIQATRKAGRTRRLIKLRVLEALAHRSCGRTADALSAMSRAIDLARSGGFLRCILDEGPLVTSLLREFESGHSAADRRQEFLQRLLASAGEAGPEIQGAGFQALEPLTEREKRILVLLTDGSTNEEIAKTLFVSRNTVKFHLKNIYSKLAVNSRLQAINAARAMGLVR